MPFGGHSKGEMTLILRDPKVPQLQHNGETVPGRAFIRKRFSFISDLDWATEETDTGSLGTIKRVFFCAALSFLALFGPFDANRYHSKENQLISRSAASAMKFSCTFALMQ